ncbi:hypothetical protein [Halobacillus mangrovi]|uniref:hypothetical protein n=1 Tax=Halobacillus mangrovi TaxID=402384 RepID=UPI003D979754
MPVEFMPEVVQNISKALPQYWALQGYKEVILSDGGVSDIWLNLFILIVAGVAGGILALVSYPRFLRQSRS